ncbi:MAG: hypothetical protein AAF597_04430 [Bacteroidota bacterium]
MLGAAVFVWSYKWLSNGIYRILEDDPALVFKWSKDLTQLGPPLTTTLNFVLLDAQERKERRNANLKTPGSK